MPSRQDTHLTEREELALRALAMIERTTFAEQRRVAVRAHAAAALADPHIAAIVDATLTHRREQSNVVRFPERRAR